jgi:hypothetical protein
VISRKSGRWNRVELTVRLDNTRPMGVADVGRCLQALGDQFEDFVFRHGLARPRGGARFPLRYIDHLGEVLS